MTDLNDYTAETLRAWAADFRTGRVAWLRGRNISATGALASSIAESVSRQEGAVTLEMSFEDHGRFIDMKQSSISHDKWGRDGITRLEAWVRKRGVERFRAGYLRKRKYLPKGEQKLVNSIAWGIAINRTKGKFKRKQWYNKPKSAAITELYNQVAAGMLDIVADNMSDTLQAPGANPRF